MCWLVMVGVRRLRGDAAAVFRKRGYVAEAASNPQRTRPATSLSTRRSQ